MGDLALKRRVDLGGETAGEHAFDKLVGAVRWRWAEVGHFREIIVLGVRFYWRGWFNFVGKCSGKVFIYTCVHVKVAKGFVLLYNIW